MNRLFYILCDLSIHAAHTALVALSHRRNRFGNICYDTFCSQQCCRDRRSILKRRARNFRRVYNAGFDHVDVFVFVSVETVICFLASENIIQNYGSVKPRISGYLSYGFFYGCKNYLCTGLFVSGKFIYKCL